MNSTVLIPNPVKSPRIQLFVCFAHHFTMQFQVKVTVTCLQSHITFTKEYYMLRSKMFPRLCLTTVYSKFH